MPGNVLLLTGPPGCGKTTVIRRVAERLRRRLVGGFLTEEIRGPRARVGFRICTFDGAAATLAHVDFPGPRVGKYGVDTKALDRICERAFGPADLYLVDEIGKMECLSERFVAAVRRVLDSGRPVIATVALHGRGFVEEVKRRPDAEIWTVDPGSRDGMPDRILAWLTE